MKKVLERRHVSAEWKIEPASAEMTRRLDKLELTVMEQAIQISCLRKQVLDIEGKKSYTEQAREYADMRSSEDG